MTEASGRSHGNFGWIACAKRENRTPEKSFDAGISTSLSAASFLEHHQKTRDISSWRGRRKRQAFVRCAQLKQAVHISSPPRGAPRGTIAVLSRMRISKLADGEERFAQKLRTEHCTFASSENNREFLRQLTRRRTERSRYCDNGNGFGESTQAPVDFRAIEESGC